MAREEQRSTTAYALEAAVFESISDGVIVCDDTGAVLLINRAARSLLSLTEHAPLPSHLSDLPFQRTSDQTIGMSTENGDYTLGEHTFHATASALRDSDQHTPGTVIVLRDVSADVAGKTDVMDFIGAMSHELGKPLTPISGNLDLLLRGYAGPLSDDQTDLIQQARNWVARLNTAIRNTVAVASIEANQSHPELQSIALAKTVQGSLALLKNGFAAKNIDVQLHIPSDLPNALVDSNHLRQILMQLLDNARRFTSRGTVTISARAENELLRVDIADTGIGIPLEEQPRLFTRFHWIMRGDGSERGSGLGLYIVRQLVERQGGRIWLERSSEAGSMFSFVLRRANDA